MSYFENRNKIIDRIEKELIGPGSDIFLCDDDFSNEIIEGKPLQRYFSAILFPKQIVTDDSETGKGDFSQNDDEEFDIDKNIIFPAEETEKVKNEIDEDLDDESAIPETS